MLFYLRSEVIRRSAERFHHVCWTEELRETEISDFYERIIGIRRRQEYILRLQVAMTYSLIM